MNERISSNMEMYLKTIFRLGRNGDPVRVKAIAGSLGVTMPSVSEALRNLKARGLVDHASYGKVRLSDEGRHLAASVDERFESLRRFLVNVLRVDDSVAEKEACEIEHVMGADTFRRMTAFLEWMECHKQDVEHCIVDFHRYLDKLLEGDNHAAERLLKGSALEEVDNPQTQD